MADNNKRWEAREGNHGACFHIYGRSVNTGIPQRQSIQSNARKFLCSIIKDVRPPDVIIKHPYFLLKGYPGKQIDRDVLEF
jgi:hypothetical protein